MYIYIYIAMTNKSAKTWIIVNKTSIYLSLDWRYEDSNSDDYYRYRFMLSNISPADTRRWINVGLTLVQRRRMWTNVKPTLIQHLVSAGRLGHMLQHFNLSLITCHYHDLDANFPDFDPSTPGWLLLNRLEVYMPAAISTSLQVNKNYR